MFRPEFSLIVTTFQMPWHLELVLASIERQTVGVRFELIVSDDGSNDRTEGVVAAFAKRVSFPVRFVSHPHEGFHLSRCRNEGVRAASTDYFIFLDGDTLIPPNHLEAYVTRRMPRVVRFGYCAKFDEATTARIHPEAVLRGEFVGMESWASRLAVLKMRVKNAFYTGIGHATKPRLKGGNVGIFRDDYEAVNGYDERFRNWGCEDDDFGARLRAAGLKTASILGHTQTYHLWHPPSPGKTQKWTEGPNVAYHHRPGRLTCCVQGLKKRNIRDLRIALNGASESICGQLHPHLRPGYLVAGRERSEVEVAFASRARRFEHEAECRILVLDTDGLANDSRVSELKATADYVLDSSRSLLDRLSRLLGCEPDKRAGRIAA